jgi:hypothetical protein
MTAGLMERFVECFLVVTAFIIGLSHIFRSTDWAEAFLRLHQLGRPAAFINGALSLIPGTLILAGHPTWTFPEAVLTGFGYLLVLKATFCFLAPDKALRSMKRGGHSPQSFVAAGVALLAVGAWACYCLWRSG